jgi:CDP-Glycerol:Poly(glycerophosphate) glycerophosphotransferase
MTSPIRDRKARDRLVGAVSLQVLTLAGAVAAAAAQSGWGTVGALVVAVFVEVWIQARWPRVNRLLARVGAGGPTRLALRLLALLLLAARCLPSDIVIGTAVAGVVAVGAAVASEAARLAVARMRQLPLVTRNLDLGDFALPAAPPSFVAQSAPIEAVAAVAAAVGLSISMHGSGAVAASIGLALAVVLAALPAVVLAWDTGVLVRARLRVRLTEAATTAIEGLAPQVVLYFDATPAELYQLRMWLEPVARLAEPAMVILRSYEVFDALGDVAVPVVCTPYNGTIASIPLPDPVVALFVTHSGNNLSMLRRPEARSAFIGHGDSDKPDSVNPFARVYDQVWVAGPLGRRRYAGAGIGLDEHDIIEVGRPQVPGAPAEREVSSGPALTVVYAPTWEGWGDDPHHSSLPHVGPALVALLAEQPDVRVRYRPHPLTGRRSAELRAAHQRVIELVGRVPDDESLAETFATATVLVGDVSSVINEFLPYDRPYAVVDPRGLGDEAFVARFPSAAGGYVLSPQLDELDALLAVARGGFDATARARRELLADALGDPATAQERFAAAVTRLLA